MFLNFGRDAQAEDVLKEALVKNPANIPVQLKLLSIYANRKDVNSFSTIARQIKESGDTTAWEQAAALGRGVDSSNPMYAGTGGGAAVAPTEAPPGSGMPSAMPALDMDIGFNIPMDLDVTSAAHPVSTPQTMDFDVSAHAASPMDFDVTGSHENVTEALLPDFDVTGSRQDVAQPQRMDFDVTGSQPNVTAASPQHMDFDVTGSQPNVTAAAPQHLDFDVTGSHPNVTSAATQHMDFDVTGSHPNVMAAATQHMDFDMTGSQPNVTEIPTQHMDFDVTGSHPNITATQHMDFDVTGSHPSVSADFAPEDNMSTVVLSAPMDMDISSSSSTAAVEVPSVFGGMDFDISSSSTASPAVGGTSSSLSGMDFDISSSPPAASPAAAESLSGLGEMDFDISSSPGSPAAGASPGLSGMDFDISSTLPAQAAKPEPAMDLGLSGISLDLGAGDTVVFPVAESKKEEHSNEVANKLDLARAFQEMGDVDTARELLGEVLNEGSSQQIEAARALIQQL